MPDDQERLAERTRDVLARFEGHALLLQRVGRGRLLDLGIGGRRQRDDHQRDALVAILEAGKILAHGHSRRRRQPDAGTRGIDDIGRLRGWRGMRSTRASGNVIWANVMATPTEPNSGENQRIRVGKVRHHGLVTRRMVRLMRPPSGSSVDVPGMIRSTP